MNDLPVRPEFATHALTESGLDKVHAARVTFSEALTHLEMIVPPGRPRSIMITKLEEACMFAVRAIAEDPANHIPNAPPKTDYTPPTTSAPPPIKK